MKMLLSLFFCIFILIKSKIFNNLPDINLPNFDVREKFSDCYNHGLSSTYNEITCYTNWPIQFSLMVTDKLCIIKGMKTKVLSSMNINSCMKLKEQIQDCKSLREFYSDTTSAFGVVNETIKFFNEKSSQFLDEFPYTLLRDDDEKPGYFPPCNDFNSSIKNISFSTDYEIFEEVNKDHLKIIKQLIFEEGPLLAYIDSKLKIKKN